MKKVNLILVLSLFFVLLSAFTLPTDEKGVYYARFSNERDEFITCYFAVDDSSLFTIQANRLLVISEKPIYAYTEEGKIVFEPFTDIPYFVDDFNMKTTIFEYENVFSDNLPRKKADFQDNLFMITLFSVFLFCIFNIFRKG